MNSQVRRSKYVTPEEHVWFRVLAIGLINREVLIRDSSTARFV